MSKDPDYLSYVGLTTKETIRVGFGYRTWPLLAFCGPVFNDARLSPAVIFFKHYLVLPRPLLVLLYERFEQANPDGCVLADSNELDDVLFAPEATEPGAIQSALWEDASRDTDDQH